MSISTKTKKEKQIFLKVGKIKFSSNYKKLDADHLLWYFLQEKVIMLDYCFDLPI